MNCSFCGSEIRSKLGFDTIFKTKEKFELLERNLRPL